MYFCFYHINVLCDITMQHVDENNIFSGTAKAEETTPPEGGATESSDPAIPPTSKSQFLRYNNYKAAIFSYECLIFGVTSSILKYFNSVLMFYLKVT